jgi:translation initiation factor 3 subunit J
MTDNWDDDEDDWDADDDELDKRLGLVKIDNNKFADDEDLALKEKELTDQRTHTELKKKGNALVAKREAEKQRLEEEEIARRAMDLEAEAEANLSPDELRKLKQRQVEEADNALTDDLFGNVDKFAGANAPVVVTAPGDKLVLKDMRDHLRHANKVGEALTSHGKIHLAQAFIKELIQKSKDVLDDDAVQELIKTLNVIKNDKVQAAKRKVKGQAQKAKKDKSSEIAAKKKYVETFGDNDNYDEVDEVGANYEDAFF